MSITPYQHTLDYVPLGEEHLDQIMDIEVEAYPEPWSRSMFREEIRNDRSYFTAALRDGEFIGYSGFWLVLDEAHITSVTVARTFRGLGYGRAQTQHLLDVARDRGVRLVTLEVRDSNASARKLYESFGFTAVGVRKGYYSKTHEDAIVMTKELD